MKKIKFIKPCPYCGSKAELREHWGDCSKSPSWYEVECTNQDCGRCQDTAHEAVEAWNKRHPTVDAILSDVRRLVEVVKLIHMLECENFYKGCVCLSCSTRNAVAAVERHLATLKRP